MDQEDKKALIENMLQTLIQRISRRTDRVTARKLMKSVITDLQGKYEFLENIIIDDELYSELQDDVVVQPEINQIDEAQFYTAMRDIIDLTVTYLKRNADYFFIREVKEAVKEIGEYELQIRGINLGRMQTQYIYDRKQALKINVQQRITQLLTTTTTLFCKYNQPEHVFSKLYEILLKNQPQFNFLSYIHIEDKSQITIEPELNNILLSNVGRALQRVLDQMMGSFEWNPEESFIQAFEYNADEEFLADLKEIGIVLREKREIPRVIDHEILIEKILEVMISIMREEQTLQRSIHIIHSIVEQHKKDSIIFQHITFSKNEANDQFETITIDSKINLVEPYKLGRAIREFIRLIHLELNDTVEGFIDMFKQRMGEEYLAEIESVGVNLHFLEFKYVQKQPRTYN